MKSANSPNQNISTLIIGIQIKSIYLHNNIYSVYSLSVKLLTMEDVKYIVRTILENPQVTHLDLNFK